MEDLWFALKLEARILLSLSFECTQKLEIMVVDGHDVKGTVKKVLVVKDDALTHLPVLLHFV